MKNYKLQEPTLNTICKVHAPDYWDEALKVSHNQANAHNVDNRKSFETEGEINYIIKWFWKAHNLVLIGKYILIFILAQDYAFNEVRLRSTLCDCRMEEFWKLMKNEG